MALETPLTVASRIMTQQIGEARVHTTYETTGGEVLDMIASGYRAGLKASWGAWKDLDLCAESEEGTHQVTQGSCDLCGVKNLES